MVWIILSAISVLFLVVVLDWLVIGFAIPDQRFLRKRGKRSYAKEYILESPNYMAYQKTTECSGFQRHMCLEALEWKLMEMTYMQK